MGHGDMRLIVLAPNSIQEMTELTCLAFDLADLYRTPVMILADGILGQMMEPVYLPDAVDVTKLPKFDWATDGTKTGDQKRIISSLYINPDELEALNHKLFKVYAEMAKNETEAETYMTDDAEVVLTGYGIVGRIAKSAVDMLRAEGIKAGMIRPITLYPFPSDTYTKVAGQKNVKKVITFELNMGQMVEDVRLAVNGAKPVEFYGRCGGNLMSPEEIVAEVKRRG
jgi:2-oxoglutarate ferredoxin oxidoreductase subunit alpha